MRLLPLLVLAAGLPGCLTGQDRDGAPQTGDGGPGGAAVNAITSQRLDHHIAVLAHDSMRGRSTVRPEIEMAARYVAEQFRSFGLAPGGDSGSFIQRYSIEQVRLDTAGSRISIGGATWRFGRELALPPRVELVDREISGPVVIVSGVPGRSGPLDHVDGAIVLVVPPAGAAQSSSRILDGMVNTLRSRAAVLLFPFTASDAAWAQLASRPGPVEIRTPWTPGPAPLVWVRDQALAQALSTRGVDLALLRRADYPARAAASDFRVSVRIKASVNQSVAAPNVVAILKGSDPALAGEHLVYSAHMDHIGVRTPDLVSDSINNGADDNASGTAAVIELARAFSMLQPGPKRSMVFLTVSGEEMGLLGSDYFATHPPVPIEQIVANFNADMLGRNWKDTVVVIGQEHSDLGATLSQVSARHPELRMSPVRDLWPSQRFFFRSDHYNFARRGVPALFFFNGVHADYHQPSDEHHKIDAEKQSRIVKLMFHLGLEVANLPERPQWNPESYRRIVEGGR